MSQQTLNLHRSVQIVRRHRLLVGIVIALGILAGGAYAVLKPPLVTSTAEVLLSQSGQAAQTGAQAVANGSVDPFTATQEVIAKSTPVLQSALPDVRPAMSIIQLRRDIQVGSLTPYIISISAQAKAGGAATTTANAVANSYIHFVGSASNAGGPISASMLQLATVAPGTGLIEHTAIYVVLGAIFGLLIGSVIALAMSRSDRRLRERDEIANSIGVPVLASFPVEHATDARGWAKLLDEYKPGATHALQLRRTLQQLELAALEANAPGQSGNWSCLVLSLASDPRALALGPQIAAFAASQGISTALVIGPQQDATVTAALRTACSAAPNRAGNLQVHVTDDDRPVPSDALLTLVVVVVDSRSPKVPETLRTAVTLLGVSSGAATADQLARAAVSAASDRRDVTGILVANPDPDDTTTGHLPQLGPRRARRMPTRMTGIATEIRR